MGFSKNKLEEYRRRGFGEVPNKYVCQDCVNNTEWKEQIRQMATNQSRQKCSYGDNRLATIPLDKFISHCIEFINANYDRVWEDWGIKPDEETNKYPCTTWDTWDLVHDIIANKAGIGHEELLKDIAKAIMSEQDTIWCEHDVFSK